MLGICVASVHGARRDTRSHALGVGPAATLGAVWLDRRRAPLVDAVIEAVGDLARAGGLDAS